MYDFPTGSPASRCGPDARPAINTRRFRAPWPNATMGRGWSGQGMDGSLTQPNYAKLSADPVMNVLQPKNCTSDPPPPLRFCNSFYLLPSYPAEYIGRNPAFGSIPNFIQEDTDPRPNHEQLGIDARHALHGGGRLGARRPSRDDLLPRIRVAGPWCSRVSRSGSSRSSRRASSSTSCCRTSGDSRRRGGAVISTTTPLVRQRGMVSAAALSRQKGGVQVAAPVARHR